MNGKELRAIRLRLDITQSQMAEKLLMSRVMYGLNERGLKPISERTGKLALTLEIEKNPITRALFTDTPSP